MTGEMLYNYQVLLKRGMPAAVTHLAYLLGGQKESVELLGKKPVIVEYPYTLPLCKFLQ